MNLFQEIGRKESLLLILLWALLTAYNLSKPVHIDDTFHLDVARAVQEDPLRAYAHSVNWQSGSAPIYEFNQPPAFFYLMAGWMTVFDDSIAGLHVLVSLFLLFGLFYFRGIVSQLDVGNSSVFLWLLASSPVLLVNQNIMVDIPLMTLLLGAYYYLLKYRKSASVQWSIYAMIMLSMALMTKYSAVPHAVLICSSMILFSLKKRHWLVVLIPLMVLGLWAVYTLWLYGDVHFLSRSLRPFDRWKIWTFLTNIGAMFPVSLLLLPRFSLRQDIIALTCFSILWSLVFVLESFGYEFLGFSILEWAFMVHGLFILTLLLIRSFVVWRTRSRWEARWLSVLLLLVIGFVLYFTPFIATRHLLLFIPWILLLIDGSKLQQNKLTLIFSICLSVILSFSLGSADLRSARFYQNMAAQPEWEGRDVDFSFGHWGWRYYAEQAGIPTYDANRDTLKDGDLITYAYSVHRQQLPENTGMKILNKKYEMEEGMILSVSPFTTLYHSYPHFAPWRLADEQPLDTVFLAEILTGENWVIERIKRDSEWFEQVKIGAIKDSISLDSALINNARWVLREVD